MWGFGNKKEEPKKEETKVVKQETKSKTNMNMQLRRTRSKSVSINLENGNNDYFLKIRVKPLEKEEPEAPKVQIPMETNEEIENRKRIFRNR